MCIQAPFIRANHSDKGLHSHLMLKMSAFEFLYGGQLTLQHLYQLHVAWYQNFINPLYQCGVDFMGSCPACLFSLIYSGFTVTVCVPVIETHQPKQGALHSVQVHKANSCREWNFL